MTGLMPSLPEVAVPGRDAYHLIYPSRAALRPSARAFREWWLDYSAAAQTR